MLCSRRFVCSGDSFSTSFNLVKAPRAPRLLQPKGAYEGTAGTRRERAISRSLARVRRTSSGYRNQATSIRSDRNRSREWSCCETKIISSVIRRPTYLASDVPSQALWWSDRRCHTAHLTSLRVACSGSRPWHIEYEANPGTRERLHIGHRHLPYLSLGRVEVAVSGWSCEVDGVRLAS